MRIKGHVKYTPQPAQPMGSSFTASAERKAQAKALITAREQATDENVYAYLLEIAKKGERAPTMEQILYRFRGGVACVGRLAREGKIRIEVWAWNWRVIEIEGFRTKASPTGARPYRVIQGVKQ